MIEWDNWQECLGCKEKCCCFQRKISYPLFLMNEERKNLPGINDCFPCKFISENSLCLVYDRRPTDCRLFPFDIIEEKGLFFWVYWNTECPITKAGYNNEWESRLLKAEKEILPQLEKFLWDYSHFRIDEFIRNFGKYVILRAIRT